MGLKQIQLEGFIYDTAIHLSNETNTGCLGYIGDHTTQLCGDYNINQDSMGSIQVSEVCVSWLTCLCDV